MINKSALNQAMLFDVHEFKMHPKAYDRLRGGWQGLFRETILQLMPVEGIEDNFSKTTGQPTKELHSICGFIFVMEFMDWTIDRYKALLIENELAGQIMQNVTKTIVNMLGIKIDKQRRLATRRRNEETDEFRDKYRIRSGIEAANSSIKRVTGLARLRVRGKASVFHAILLKVAGWNLLQAARALRLRGRAQNGQDASNFGMLHAILPPYFTTRLTQAFSTSLSKASPPLFKNRPSLFPGLAN